MNELRIKFGKWVALAAFVLAALVYGAGCGGGDTQPSGPSDEGMVPEAIAVRDAFAEAHPSYRNPINELLGIAKVAPENPVAYAEVIPQLERISTDSGLTPEQKQALDALVKRLKADAAAARRR